MTALAAGSARTPRGVFDELMAARRGDPAEDLLARIFASWLLGLGALPDWLGLGETGFRALLVRHFPGIEGAAIDNPGRPLSEQRRDEIRDLRRLLLDHRTTGSETEAGIAGIVAAGCLGADHLWQDLGLWNRADLSRLMMDHFAPLARRNVKDMKWKKFLYKQLCETEGVNVCRSPSCEVCDDYLNCYGPED